MKTLWLDRYKEEDALGPIQRDEALLLYAITRVTRPKRILEFGTMHGHSALAWLKGGVGELWTVDIRNRIDPRITDEFGGRIKIFTMDMTEFRQPADVAFDLVFFDAAHNLEKNQATFNNLPPPPMIIVHDTGTWATEHMRDAHRKFPGVMTDGGKIHQPAEVAFCDWLESTHGYRRVDFHSMNTVRHGMTILQKV